MKLTKIINIDINVEKEQRIYRFVSSITLRDESVSKYEYVTKT